MSRLYNIVIQLYRLSIYLASPFNSKARLWIRGRKGLMSELASVNPHKKPVIWVHCASLGEFEQGRPVIEGLRTGHKDHFILLTFFSPSGYEIRKSYGQVDHVSYMPIDSRKNARTFLDLINPSLIVFVKYEFWFNYIEETAKRNIPMAVVSANFRKDQHFFMWYGGWFRKRLRLVNTIFVQRNDSAELLQSIGITSVVVSGDTRFDRVASIASQAETEDWLDKFKGKLMLLLAGSTWPADEDIILKAYQHFKDKMKLVIVPHEVHLERIRQLERQVKEPYTLYSSITDKDLQDTRILIVDRIGLLSGLYRYADIAYIGGGFGAGIHNILEAAAYGKPVIFGPNYRKFREAIDLTARGGAFSIKHEKQLYDKIVSLTEDKDAYQEAASISAAYVKNNQGATKVILDKLNELMTRNE